MDVGYPEFLNDMFAVSPNGIVKVVKCRPDNTVNPYKFQMEIAVVPTKFRTWLRDDYDGPGREAKVGNSLH